MQPWVLVTVTFFETARQGFGATVVAVDTGVVPVVLLGVLAVVVLEVVVVDTTLGVVGTTENKRQSVIQ
jgi:hypothetical protein